MCGIVGVVSQSPVNQEIFDALTMLQHRGQDAAGIITAEHDRLHLHKNDGLVRDVFHSETQMARLKGNMGIGHVRYPTAGTSSTAEAQPFYTNSPFGLSLAHNGNLTNTADLRKELLAAGRRHLNTESDSEVLLNIFAQELMAQNTLVLQPEDVFAAVTRVHRRIKGAYACTVLITGYGVVGFRDPFGIRPAVYGRRETPQGPDYMIASESVALDALGYSIVADIAPGEAVLLTEDGQVHVRQCAPDVADYAPCLFEYVYMARPDSVMDGVYVYKARLRMGQKLAEKIKREWPDHDIDVVIPIPDTSRVAGAEMAMALDVPYREGFIKNRYIGRTFIMPGQAQRKRSVRYKLNPVDLEFKGKNVLLVDDSIVRGTTSREIVQMARDAGARKVYFASAAPPVRFPNVYGIDMPTVDELVAHGRTEEELRIMLGCDRLIFQDLHDLIEAVRHKNVKLKQFDTSVFTGEYVTGDVSADYLNHIGHQRSDSAKQARVSPAQAVLDLHNAATVR